MISITTTESQSMITSVFPRSSLYFDVFYKLLKLNNLPVQFGLKFVVNDKQINCLRIAWAAGPIYIFLFNDIFFSCAIKHKSSPLFHFLFSLPIYVYPSICWINNYENYFIWRKPSK